MWEGEIEAEGKGTLRSAVHRQCGLTRRLLAPDPTHPPPPHLFLHTTANHASSVLRRQAAWRAECCLFRQQRPLTKRTACKCGGCARGGTSAAQAHLPQYVRQGVNGCGQVRVQRLGSCWGQMQGSSCEPVRALQGLGMKTVGWSRGHAHLPQHVRRGVNGCGHEQRVRAGNGETCGAEISGMHGVLRMECKQRMCNTGG